MMDWNIKNEWLFYLVITELMCPSFAIRMAFRFIILQSIPSGLFGLF